MQEFQTEAGPVPFASESEPVCSKTDSSQRLGTIYIKMFKNLVISL